MTVTPESKVSQYWNITITNLVGWNIFGAEFAEFAKGFFNLYTYTHAHKHIFGHVLTLELVYQDFI
jgi:hypothetical protein